MMHTYPFCAAKARQAGGRCAILAVVLVGACFATAAFPSIADVHGRQPRAVDPTRHSFPPLGTTVERQVIVEWNRFYDYAGLGGILARLHNAFPELTRLYSIGRSVEGRKIWCLEVTSQPGTASARKPGMYIDGNIHGNEVQGGEAVAYTAWYLCHQYGRLEIVTDLLDHYVFYLIPTINPDGRDRWFHHAQSPHSSRTGVKPLDNDRDGLLDEDDVDDLDGDGSITTMRIRDPDGRWKAHPDFPEFLMVRVADDERGEFSIVGVEGIDNDGDGRINEDPVGGYDMNRNWAWDWQPTYVQYGAEEYPFSLPETRAVADFVIQHPNIAAFQSYHNAGGMILRSPGREGGVMRSPDEQVLKFIAERGEKMLPFYRSMIIWKDLYTVWGGEIDWFYGARGILGFSNELWNMRNTDRTDRTSRESEAAFLKYLLMNEGVVPWHPYEHPTYGSIEIGGTRKEWGRTPVSFLLEEECHRNMAFTLYHAGQMPRLQIRDVTVDRLADRLFKVRVTVENSRLIPTRTIQDVRHHISPPDVVTLRGRDVRVLTAGRVTDRYLNRVEPVERRPERVELDRIGGLSSEQVQFVVEGRGPFTVEVDSAKGGQFSRIVQEPR